MVCQCSTNCEELKYLLSFVLMFFSVSMLIRTYASLCVYLSLTLFTFSSVRYLWRDGDVWF